MKLRLFVMDDRASEILKMGHLLQRAGFGETYSDLNERSQQGFNAVINQLLDDAQKPDDGKADWVLDVLVKQDRQNKLRVPMLKAWWIYRMATTDNPLQEKLTLFWHGHFATSVSKVPPDLMLQQNRFFRQNALGNWREMLRGISRDPAMVVWLDNNTNVKSHANENYSRELMELFSLGIGNYTETDVREGGRAFTGWTERKGEFFFDERQHDNGIKTFLAHTGNLDGDDILDIILEQPAAAEFFARKLFIFFAHDNPSREVITPLAVAFRQSNYDLRTLVEAIFRSPAFWSIEAMHTQIKSPTQLVVGSLRSIGLGEELALMSNGPQDSVSLNRLRRVCWIAMNNLRQMGQDLFNPPDVKGWDGGLAWINSETMIERLNCATILSGLLAPGGLEKLVGAVTALPQDKVDCILSNLGPLVLPYAVHTTLVDILYGTGTESMKPYQQAAHLRSALSLAMQTPGYQLC